MFAGVQGRPLFDRRSLVRSMAKIFCSVLLRNSLCHFARNQSANRKIHLSNTNMIKVDETIPSVDLHETTPGNVVNMGELCKEKKVVMFGLPGAFTPNCSKTHLPGYVERYLEFKKKGVDEVVCVSVNDAFVMDAWGKSHDAIGKIRMLADPNATFTKAIGLDLNIPGLGGVRSKRYSMIIENGVVKFLAVEPDGTGVTCSLATKLPL